MNQVDRTQHQNNLLSAALAYGEQGLYIIPLHEPIFDSAGHLSGCSCEAYKRSSAYKGWLEDKGLRDRFDPNFKCRTPGKHPRLLDWEAKASKDPEQIRAWWRKYPTANIGLAPGKSGLIVVDHDTYKDNYAGGDLITHADEQTVTVITQSGGAHLYFQKPAGKSYTNANNTLPDGVDIRCDGGMTVLPTSIGPSGNPYQWEDGYSIFEINPLPLPKALEAILDEAHAKHTTAKTVTFTTPTTERPELIRWKISKPTRELINNPPPQGNRSEADYSVCLSLAYAGATDDEILGVFQHYPIGTRGKYAERGDYYLALTIGRARAFAEANPRPDVGPTINAARLWIKTHSFAEFIPADLRGEHYRTDSTDTKLADAILDVMEARGLLEVNVGLKRLAKLAGINSTRTVNAALARLHGWLIEVTPDVQGTRILLCEHSRFEQIAPPLSVYNPPVFKGVQFSENDSNEYSPHKADDAFLFGTSGQMRERFGEIARALDVTIKQAKEIDTETFAALGETCLRLRDAHGRCGDMTASEAAEETGKKLAAVRSAYRKMEALGLVEVEREGPRGPKVYSFVSDFWPKVEELTPNLRTYGLSNQRENKRLESAQQWAQRGEALATPAEEEKKKSCQRRFVKLARQRLPLLASLHPDLSPAAIEHLAYDVPAYKRSPEQEAKIRGYRTQARIAHRQAVSEIVSAAGAALDAGKTAQDIKNEVEAQGFNKDMVRSVLSTPRLFLHAAQQTGQTFLFENIAQLQASGASRKEIIVQLEQGGFTPDEITAALSKPAPTTAAPAFLFSGLSYADAWQQFTKLREQMPVAMAKNADGYYLQLRQVAA